MAHPAALGLVGRIALEARRSRQPAGFCFGDALTIKDRPYGCRKSLKCSNRGIIIGMTNELTVCIQ